MQSSRWARCRRRRSAAPLRTTSRRPFRAPGFPPARNRPPGAGKPPGADKISSLWTLETSRAIKVGQDPRIPQAGLKVAAKRPSLLEGSSLTALDCCKIEDMWIVRLALRRPYTFVVMAVLIAILGGIGIVT